MPILVGITGGIGSGKSTVAKIFSLLSIPVYFADHRAKWLMSHDESLKIEIINAFGALSYDSEGSLDRTFLANTVFSDPEKIKTINSLVHPAVGKDFLAWASQQTTPYVLKEAALIFESGGNQALDFVINVSSPLKVRIGRILMRDSFRSEEQVNQIINQQLPDEQKNELADFVIKNTDNKLLIPQVLEIHQKLISKQ
ncbi:dephospho-CoA kinase [Algoriphagus ratkowskyi]|nr:dephospho-CoA kinase [Algoriphagus ratkowskyi]